MGWNEVTELDDDIKTARRSTMPSPAPTEDDDLELPSQILIPGPDTWSSLFQASAELHRRKDDEAGDAQHQCECCLRPMKTQNGLNQRDVASLRDLTLAAHALLKHPREGSSDWTLSVSTVLADISLLLQRAGI